ncbi:hypothetical protein Avbf_05968 [Armadillidium vulgare]|nr:hypothetical protein Avbf_05968 [Armadillidium vulgare]
MKILFAPFPLRISPPWDKESLKLYFNNFTNRIKSSFLTCLKQIGTGAADVVGNVFFRLVKASCFDFKKRKHVDNQLPSANMSK